LYDASAMSVLVPASLDEALHRLADDPTAHVLAGGTDLMVEVNMGHRRPPSVLAVAGLPELQGWRHDEAAATVWLGAGLTYRDMADAGFARLLPALSEAARTVGSPQIRNAGTIGGNLATCSPAGDALPVLSALDATIELASAAGRREIPTTCQPEARSARQSAAPITDDAPVTTATLPVSLLISIFLFQHCVELPRSLGGCLAGLPLGHF
jgi:CO/xanthine dehydrogenase FAD-binding subunit